MRKGFTLIELLAVIVVLAIILLIAMPIVLNVISDARKGAFEASARGLVKTVENQYMEKYLKGNQEATDYVFVDWEQTMGDPLTFRGRGPKDGILRVYDEGDIEIAINDNNWCVTKNRDKTSINSAVPYDGECELPSESIGIIELPEEVYSDDEISCLISSDCEGVTLPDSVIGTEGTWIPVASASELNNVRNTTSNTFGAGTVWQNTYTGGLDKNYIQVANIDLSGYSNWEPIGYSSGWVPFVGSYNGGNYVISNLTIEQTDTWGVGLFGVTETSKILYTRLVNVDIVGDGAVGALVGSTNGCEITNSYVSQGKVEGLGYEVGGLVGYNWNSSINSSYAYLTVIADGYVGGLVGAISGVGSVSESFARGLVIGQEDVGGLVGNLWNSNTISDSYASGLLVGDSNVGGLIGSKNASDVITNSYYDILPNNGLGDYRDSTDMTYPYNNGNTYIGWNFSDVWEITDGVNDGYPYLLENKVANISTENFVPDGYLIDIRDDQIYKTVQIGDQVWMAEDLNIGTRIQGVNNQGNSCDNIEKYCPANLDANCNVYGGLYQWDQAMCGSESPGARGICPVGWHIPTDDEWKAMEIYLGMTPVQADENGYRGTDQGLKIKSVSVNGNNSTGFSAVLAGIRWGSGTFGTIGIHNDWWTSTLSATDARVRYVGLNYDTIGRDIYGTHLGLSVRCIKD